MSYATRFCPHSDVRWKPAPCRAVWSDRYPGPTLEDVLKVKARVESFGLRLAAIEGYVPMENLKEIDES